MLSLRQFAKLENFCTEHCAIDLLGAYEECAVKIEFNNEILKKKKKTFCQFISQLPSKKSVMELIVSD